MEEMPKIIELHYSSALSNINFIKKQEWIYTTSALAVYGALFAGVKNISTGICAKIFLTLAIAFSLAFSALIYYGMAKSLNTSRDDLDQIVQGKPRNWFDKWGLFAGLGVIVAIGAIIVMYAVWKAPLHC
jgi:amino acid transporter